MKKYYFLIFFAVLVLKPFFVFAAEFVSDLTLSNEDIRFSTDSLIEGQNVKIYASITNLGTKDALGTVRFYDAKTGTQIDSDQPISVIAGKTDDVFVDWIPVHGTYSIQVIIDPWTSETDDSSNNNAIMSVSVDIDSDRDGTGDKQDIDDDNDGVQDSVDAFPTNPQESEDTDQDGVGNNADTNDDGDGVLDSEDAFPQDVSETFDTDQDGVGDNADTDDDNDGISDTDEAVKGTDVLRADSDSDGVSDKSDPFPTDATENRDFDRDDIGDTQDADDDNDGLLDEEDSNDENKGPEIVVSDVPSVVSKGTEITLSAANTIDPDGNIQFLEWAVYHGTLKDKNDENVATRSRNAVFSTILDKPGLYTIQLTAIDDKGESRLKVFEVRVRGIGLYWFLGIALALVIIFSYTRIRIPKKS